MSRKIKVLQINSHFLRGGAGKIMSYLHTELINNGHQCLSLFGRDCDIKTDAGIVRFGNKITNYFDAFCTRITGNVGSFSYFSTKKAIRIIKAYCPDVIHLHVLHGYYLNNKVFFNFLAKSGIPCIWTFHDCQAFTGKCGYPYNCEKYVTGCHNCEQLKSYPKVLFFDKTNKMWALKHKMIDGVNLKAIVTPSEWLGGLVKKTFFSKKTLLTINNGIDINIFRYTKKETARRRLGLPNDMPIALFVAFGKNDPRKGLTYVLEVAKKHPEILFILIGGSDSKADLKNIKSIDFVSDQKELALYYSSADVFLIPSIAENYATTVVEALCCGSPVVGFNVGGIPEQISDGTGSVVEAGDVSRFEQNILDYCLRPIDDSLRAAISDKKTKSNSKENMFNKYLNLYFKVCNYEQN